MVSSDLDSSAGVSDASDSVFLPFAAVFSAAFFFSLASREARSFSAAISSIISEAYDRAKSLLATHIGKLHFIAEYLLGHEDMDGDQFKAVMENEYVTVEMIEEIAAEKERASREANEKKKAAEKTAANGKKTEAETSEPPAEESKTDETKTNPFDYSPENNGGENPFDYNRPEDKD